MDRAGGRVPRRPRSSRASAAPSVALAQRWPVRRRDRCARGCRRRSRSSPASGCSTCCSRSRAGSTAAIPGGFGTGKTVALQQIAKWCDAAVIVYVGCGERGNELADVLEEFAGARGSAYRAAAARPDGADRQHLEHAGDGARGERLHRRHGRRVLPRHGLRRRRDRRLDLALGGGAARAGLAHRRAARGGGLSGGALLGAGRRSTSAPPGCGRSAARSASVSVLGAVSPPGGDLTEPVTSHTRRFVRSVWSLDRDLAYARHYPAVSWRDSSSRDAEHARDLAGRARRSRLGRAPHAGAAPAHRRRPDRVDRPARRRGLAAGAGAPDAAHRAPAARGRAAAERRARQRPVQLARQAARAARARARAPGPDGGGCWSAACRSPRSTRSDLAPVLRARYDTPPDGVRTGAERSAASCWPSSTALGAVMAIRAPIEYTAIGSIRGPLIAVQDVTRRRLGRGRPRCGSSRARSGTGRCSTSTRTSRSSRSSRGPPACGWTRTRVAFSGAPMTDPRGRSVARPDLQRARRADRRRAAGDGRRAAAGRRHARSTRRCAPRRANRSSPG